MQNVRWALSERSRELRVTHTEVAVVVAAAAVVVSVADAAFVAVVVVVVFNCTLKKLSFGQSSFQVLALSILISSSIDRKLDRYSSSNLQ